MRKKWKRMVCTMAAVCMFGLSGSVTAWAAPELLINTETLRRMKELQGEKDEMNVTPGEMFLGLGEEGCTLMEIQESMKKYSPEAEGYYEKNCGDFIIGDVIFTIYYLNGGWEVETYEEWVQKCNETRIYPDGAPWQDMPSTLGYYRGSTYFTNPPTREQMNANIEACAVRIDAVNAAFLAESSAAEEPVTEETAVETAAEETVAAETVEETAAAETESAPEVESGSKVVEAGLTRR